MDSASALYRAYALIVISIFALIIILFAAHLNPPKESSAGDVKLPSTLNVYAIWDDGDIDVDLWVKDPSGEIIGFTHRQGIYTTLLRDDMGTETDTPKNFENLFAFEALPGEYVVNIVCWDCDDPPINVNVEISVTPKGEKRSVFFRSDMFLTKDDQELTVLKFKLDATGKVIYGSENNVQEPISQRKTQEGGSSR